MKRQDGLEGQDGPDGPERLGDTKLESSPSGLSGPSRLSCPSLYLVLTHLPGQRVAVHAQRARGLREAAVALIEHAGNESLFELAHRIVELNAAVHHFLDETLESIADHDRSSSRPVSRRNASTYLLRVLATTSSGREGTGGCLFQRICSR